MIQLVQKPEIRHALAAAGQQVTERLAALNIDGQIATDDTVKALKNLRAELNKELTDYEAQRKAIKEGVMSPYNEFEQVYKAEIAEKYKSAIDSLKTKIDSVETEIKSRKEQAVRSYFAELIASENLDFLRYEQTGIKMDLSTSEKKYKEQVNEFITKVQDDIALINSETHAAEMMAEYKLTLNASKAITTVRERKDREKAEAERLRINEIQRRETILRRMGFILRDITSTWEWIQNDSIFLKNSELEAMTTDDFQKLIISFETIIAEYKRQQEPQAAPAPIAAPVEVPQPTAPQQAPQAATAPEIFTATFRCEATREKLIALGAYMRENGIQYTNIK